MSENLQLSEEQHRKRAEELFRVAMGGLFDQLLALKMINENHYYRFFNCQSFEEFCEKYFDMAKRSAYRYIQVANKFTPLINNLANDNSVPHVALQQLGIVKLEILAVFDDSVLMELAVKGELRINGMAFTLSELKDMDREKLRELVTGKVEASEPKQMNIPFPKVYSNAEKYFTKIMNDVIACPSIIQPDKVKIRMAIEEAAKVFDMYKKMNAD